MKSRHTVTVCQAAQENRVHTTPWEYNDRKKNFEENPHKHTWDMIKQIFKTILHFFSFFKEPPWGSGVLNYYFQKLLLKQEICNLLPWNLVDKQHYKEKFLYQLNSIKVQDVMSDYSKKN